MAEIERAVQSRAQRESERDGAILQTSELLSELDKKLDLENKERKAADAEAMKYTIRWNKINLAVSIVAIIVGVAAIAVDLIFRLVI